MLKILLYWINGTANHGINFIIAHFIPMCFSQDSDLRNNGYDIINFKSDNNYYTGLIQNNPYYNKSTN